MAAGGIVCLSDLEQYSCEVMSKYCFTFYAGGAEDEVTLQENIKAFKRYQIIPRVLRDVSKLDTTTTILGHSISFPVCIAPTALHGMAHPKGELGTARGAMSMRIGYAMSSFASRAIDEVADAAEECLKFFQLYVFERRDLTLDLVRLAEKRGFRALIVTVDLPVLGNRISWRRTDQGSQTIKYGNIKGLDSISNGGDYYVDASLTWEDLKWLKSQTKLPLIVKGILTAEDAAMAVECGVAGILVSNHGGRQLDTVPASIDALANVVKAVNGRCEVYMDGGVRRGTDILKALALGARVVFIGRPAVYALAYKGEEGVRQMLTILKDEFSLAMALSGSASVNEIKQTVTLRNTLTGSRL